VTGVQTCALPISALNYPPIFSSYFSLSLCASQRGAEFKLANFNIGLKPNYQPK